MRRTIIFVLTIAVSATLSACGSLMESSGLAAPSPIPSATILVPSSTPSITVTPSVTATLDPCTTISLPNTIKPVNELMRQFDDYASLARSTPVSQMVQVIPPMQNIRRTAEDQIVPACLQQLKSYQISYMDTFIQTMLVFESVNGNPAAMTQAMTQAIKAGIAQAQKYHDQYVLELARLLGVTIAPTSTPFVVTPIPGGTGTPSSTPLPITITNSGTDTVNLHQSPSVNSPIIGKLSAGASANAIGKSEAGDWLLIQIPKQTGKTAWVYAPLISFNSGDINSLPVATPAP